MGAMNTCNEQAVNDREQHLYHGCSECPPQRGPDDIYNAGRSHWGACHVHRTAWWIGSNLFSSWRDETEAEQRERYREIEGYADMTGAINPDPDANERLDATEAFAAELDA